MEVRGWKCGLGKMGLNYGKSRENHQQYEVLVLGLDLDINTIDFYAVSVDHNSFLTGGDSSKC